MYLRRLSLMAAAFMVCVLKISNLFLVHLSGSTVPVLIAYHRSCTW